MRCKPCGTR